MLIKCVDCNKDVSDKAKICPSCGCPVSHSLKENRKNEKEEEKFKTPTEKYYCFRENIDNLKVKISKNILEKEKEKIINNINDETQNKTLVKILENNEAKYKGYFVELKIDYKQHKNQFIKNILTKLANKYSIFSKLNVSSEENNNLVNYLSVINDMIGFKIKKEALTYPSVYFFTNQTNTKEKKLYLKKHGKEEIEKKYKEYRGLGNFYPDTPFVDSITIYFDQFIEDYIILEKSRPEDARYIVKNINGKIYCFNYQFIMNIINVLKIKSTFMIAYYGVDNPAIVRNDEGEIAFMPAINMLYLI